MCILSYLPPHAETDVDGLFNGGVANPDGHGWAITDNRTGTMVVGKSLDLVEALDDFINVRERHPDGHALFHSRWATHGGVRTDNVHPFNVAGSELTVVAHNGILLRAAPAKGDPRSDTRKFADEILGRRFKRYDRATVIDEVERWIGPFNKLVVLTVDPRYAGNAYIFNEWAGEWDTTTGIWHSNGDYLGGTPHWALPTKTTIGAPAEEVDEADPTAWLCDLCEEGCYDAHGFCDTCGRCPDCWGKWDACTCDGDEPIIEAAEVAALQAEIIAQTAGVVV